MELAEGLKHAKNRKIMSVAGVVASSVFFSVNLFLFFIFSFFSSIMHGVSFPAIFPSIFSIVSIVLFTFSSLFAVLLGVSVSLMRRNGKMFSLFVLLQNEARHACTFDKLAEIWGVTPERAEKLLRKMVKKHPADFASLSIDWQNGCIYPSAMAAAPAAPQAPAAESEPAAAVPSGLNEAEAEAYPCLDRMQTLLEHTGSAEDAAPLELFMSDIRDILEESRKEGRDAADIARFFHRFLPLGENMVTRLPQLPAGDEETSATRLQILEALNHLHQAFIKKIELLSEHERMQADADVAVLEQLLRQDGLLEDGDTVLDPDDLQNKPLL